MAKNKSPPIRDTVIKTNGQLTKSTQLLAKAAQLRMAKKTREAEALERQAKELTERLNAPEVAKPQKPSAAKSPKKPPK